MAKRGSERPAADVPPTAAGSGTPTTAAGAAPVPTTAVRPEDLLVATFNDLRDELVSTLAYVLGSRDDAADAAQDTFLKCWRAIGTVPDVLNLRAWIFRVGLNTARDVQRSGWAKRAKPLIAEAVLLPSRDPDAGDSLEHRETVARLRQALADLRPEEQEVFLLRQNGEMTYEQIGDALGLPVGTVKTQMRTALIKLRKVLNPDGGEGE